MISRITSEELQIFETLSNPISFVEVMFDNLGVLTEFTEEKYSKVRLFQYPIISYISLFFENPKLSNKENFKIKKGLGDCVNFGGRLTGKSLIGIIVDVILNTWHKTYTWGVVSSCDAVKVRGVLESILTVFDNHPIFSQLHAKSKSHPAYLVTFDNGVKLESVNTNVAGKEPGKNWFQKHVQIAFEEEASFLTDSISSKRLMAQSEFGMIERLTGMANFKKVSPIGRKFFDLKNENIVINIPSYANETWDEEKDDAAVKEFGGKQSPGYRTQILGQVVDDGDSVYDIERIRECYKRDKYGDPITIKSFEINRANFYRFKEVLVLDRPSNAESVWVCLDKGEGAAPTEIIVIFKNGDIYKYEYNITDFKLSPDEDDQVVEYIVEVLKANIVGIDTTSGGGKAMFSHLAKKYPENIVGVSFNEKIAIDFERNEQNNIVNGADGKPKYKEEFIVDWSIQRLKHLFYNQKIQALFDIKLDTQFDSIVVMRSGQRTVYGSKMANHLHQAFQVFAIALWNYEFKLIRPIQVKKPGLGAY
jgi:hypothetical protein